MATNISNDIPQQEGFYIFRGVRHIRNSLFEHLWEPVEVCECKRGQIVELGVAMTGRQTRFRLDTFNGEWERLAVGENS